MKEMALIFGFLLTGLGLYAYFSPVDAAPAAVAAGDEDTTTAEENTEATEKKKKTSPTALIPAFFGLPIMFCGTISFLSEEVRKHAMHAAAGIALIGGILALGRGLMKISALFGDDPVAQRSTTIILTMGFLCLAYVLLSVNSFIAARKAREAAEAKPANPA